MAVPVANLWDTQLLHPSRVPPRRRSCSWPPTQLSQQRQIICFPGKSGREARPFSHAPNDPTQHGETGTGQAPFPQAINACSLHAAPKHPSAL